MYDAQLNIFPLLSPLSVDHLDRGGRLLVADSSSPHLSFPPILRADCGASPGRVQPRDKFRIVIHIPEKGKHSFRGRGSGRQVSTIKFVPRVNFPLRSRVV